jgi:hypothetical protein
MGFHQLQQGAFQRLEAEGREEVNDFTTSEGKRDTELLGECRSNDYGVSEPIPRRPGTAIPGGFGRTSVRPFFYSYSITPKHPLDNLPRDRQRDRPHLSTPFVKAASKR